MWSLKQQAIVAQTRGYVVFFDYTKGRPANLIETGGVYMDLYTALAKKAKTSNELAAKWEKENPSKPKEKKAKL
jgi:hypothetical protein